MEEETFDYNWIKKYEEEEKDYKMFYPEEIKYLKLNCLYVNINNELEKITEKEIKLINSNKIKKEELIKLIKDNMKLDKIKYKLLSVLIYNFNLETDELKMFLQNNEKYNLLTNLKNINDYEIESSIKYFHKVNNLYLLFNKEECNKNIANTKRVKFNLAKGKTRRNR